MPAPTPTTPPLPRAIAPILTLGLLLRLAALALLWHAPLTSDAQDYCDTARQLLTGHPFVPYWPPGLPLFLAPFAALGLADAALRLPMLLWWALATWGFLRLTRALAAVTALPLTPLVTLPLLLFTLLPVTIHLSVEPLTQLPVAALVLLALSSTLRLAQRPSLPEGTLLGLALGVMTLIRPSALPLLLLLPAVALWRSRRWQAPVLAALLGCLLVGAWVVRAHTLSGAWLINTANNQNLWDGNNPSTPAYRTWFFGSHAKPGTDEIHRYPAFEATLNQVLALPPLARPAVFGHLATQEITTHPGRFLLRTSNRIRCFFGFDTFTSLTLRKLRPRLFLPSLALEAGLYLALLAPAVFWLAARGRDFWLPTPARENWFGPNTPPRSPWPLWTILATTLLYAAPYWLSMSHPTYHLPILAPLILLGLLAYTGAHPTPPLPAPTANSSPNPDSSSNPTITPIAPEAPAISHLRGWLAVAILLAIQLEWILRAGSA